MNIAYSFGEKELIEIVAKHLNDKHGIYIPKDKAMLVVLDDADKPLVDAHLYQFFHDID